MIIQNTHDLPAACTAVYLSRMNLSYLSVTAMLQPTQHPIPAEAATEIALMQMGIAYNAINPSSGSNQIRDRTNHALSPLSNNAFHLCILLLLPHSGFIQGSHGA